MQSFMEFLLWDIFEMNLDIFQVLDATVDQLVEYPTLPLMTFRWHHMVLLRLVVYPHKSMFSATR